MNRTAEVSVIRELADNIASNLGEGSADELVNYALSDEGRESWGIEIELDDHDRNLLIRFVGENLSETAWHCPHCGAENVDLLFLTVEPLCADCSRVISWSEILKGERDEIRKG